MLPARVRLAAVHLGASGVGRWCQARGLLSTGEAAGTFDQTGALRARHGYRSVPIAHRQAVM